MRPALAIPTLSISRTAPTAITIPTVPTVSAPPRFNFAGYCDYCYQHGCQSPTCIAKHAATYWAVCPSCEGRGLDDQDDCCESCFRGVVEVFPGWPGAVSA
ncbi:hypothetical protein F4553_004469 [Allocatelliglobosispora scoriae]|uniref:Uncharacterized protein n=1 Tax=Allocatelliglobosispora scoriae TaxID=643052 RepID=A0A841BWH0_9ACTN|nr:hypothetical protein [Allocatelliglobosispora scoriae]MBB5871090.1 hypothetical protein [Allocatelliglobosispora scoriae]